MKLTWWQKIIHSKNGPRFRNFLSGEKKSLKISVIRKRKHIQNNLEIRGSFTDPEGPGPRLLAGSQQKSIPRKKIFKAELAQGGKGGLGWLGGW